MTVSGLNSFRGSKNLLMLWCWCPLITKNNMILRNRKEPQSCQEDSLYCGNSYQVLASVAKRQRVWCLLICSLLMTPHRQDLAERMWQNLTGPLAFSPKWNHMFITTKDTCMLCDFQALGCGLLSKNCITLLRLQFTENNQMPFKTWRKFSRNTNLTFCRYFRIR